MFYKNLSYILAGCLEFNLYKQEVRVIKKNNLKDLNKIRNCNYWNNDLKVFLLENQYFHCMKKKLKIQNYKYHTSLGKHCTVFHLLYCRYFVHDGAQ